MWLNNNNHTHKSQYSQQSNCNSLVLKMARQVFRTSSSEDFSWSECYGWCCIAIPWLAGCVFLWYTMIFMLIFSPEDVKFQVTEASLTQFNFTNNNNTLHYNLALTITARNPNKWIGVYYDSFEAKAFYRKKWLSTVTLTPFYQGHKNTTILGTVFEGQQLVMLGKRDLSKLDMEKSAGVYNIDVELFVQIRTKYGKIKSSHYRPMFPITCSLKLPLTSDHEKSVISDTTECVGDGFFVGRFAPPFEFVLPFLICLVMTNILLIYFIAWCVSEEQFRSFSFCCFLIFSAAIVIFMIWYYLIPR